MCFMAAKLAPMTSVIFNVVQVYFLLLNITNFAGFDPSKVGKDSGTAGSNLTCAFNKEREIQQCVSGNSNTFIN